MAHQVREVAISTIYLDPQNPRHTPIESEPEIIKELITKESIKALASDIVKRGGLNPIESLAIVKHPSVSGKFIVAEGNRRLCALKLINDPENAPSESEKRYFRTLREKAATTITKVRATIFDSREEAETWMELRHLGEQNGVGLRRWDPTQKARFDEQKGRHNPNTLSWKLIEYAKKNDIISQQDSQEISITNISRFLGTPQVRDALGLSDNKNLKIFIDEDDFKETLKQFLRDALGSDSKISSRTKADDRRIYASSLTNKIQVDRTRSGNEKSLEEPNELNSSTHKNESSRSGYRAEPDPDPDPDPVEPRKKRNNRSPDNRNNVIPKSFSTRITDKTLKRIYDELRKLDASEFYFSCSYLLRTFLENLTSIYLRKIEGNAPGELNRKFAKVCSKLSEANSFSDDELKFFRTMINGGKDTPYSAHSLGAHVHGSVIPDKVLLIKIWDNLEHIIEYLLEEVE